MRISDWSSDWCSSDVEGLGGIAAAVEPDPAGCRQQLQEVADLRRIAVGLEARLQPFGILRVGGIDPESRRPLACQGAHRPEDEEHVEDRKSVVSGRVCQYV